MASTAHMAIRAELAMNPLGLRACCSRIYGALGVPEGSEVSGGGRALSLSPPSLDRQVSPESWPTSDPRYGMKATLSAMKVTAIASPTLKVTVVDVVGAWLFKQASLSTEQSKTKLHLFANTEFVLPINPINLSLFEERNGSNLKISSVVPDLEIRTK